MREAPQRPHNAVPWPLSFLTMRGAAGRRQSPGLWRRGPTEAARCRCPPAALQKAGRGPGACPEATGPSLCALCCSSQDTGPSAPKSPTNHTREAAQVSTVTLRPRSLRGEALQHIQTRGSTTRGIQGQTLTLPSDAGSREMAVTEHGAELQGASTSEGPKAVPGASSKPETSLERLQSDGHMGGKCDVENSHCPP